MTKVKTLGSIIFLLISLRLTTGALVAQEDNLPISPLAQDQTEPSNSSAYQLLKYRSPQPKPEPTPGFSPTTSLPAPTKSSLGSQTSSLTLTLPDSIEISAAQFSKSLKVLGTTSLGATTISGPLTQDGTLLLDEGNSIDVLGGTLYLQSSGLGDINFIAGSMKLDRAGNLALMGNLDIGSNLNLGGFVRAQGISTGVISPLSRSDIRIQLGAYEASPTGFLKPEGQLIITNRKDENRLTVNEGGDLKTLGNVEGENLTARTQATTQNLNVRKDLTVGGRAEFTSLAAEQYLRSQELILDKGLRINTSRAGLGQKPGSGATAGQNIFPGGVFSYTIENTTVTQSSLIYLTPSGSLEGQTLFIRNILPGKSFTIGLDHPLTSDVPFNWLIIN